MSCWSGIHSSRVVARIAVLLLLACSRSFVAAEESVAPTDDESVEITTAMQVLELLGIGESELAQFTHGNEFSDDEFLVLHRLLARLPRFPRQRLARWQRADVDWSKTLADEDVDPSQLQRDIFRVTGTLTSLTREELPKVIAERVDYTHFYRAVIADASREVTYTAFLRRIPNAFVKPLKAGTPVLERVALTGLFLKSSLNASSTPDDEVATSSPNVFMAADLLEWFPDDAESPLVADRPDYLKLAEFGMDVGVLGTIKDRKPLTRDDREAFYQLLASVGKQPTMDVRALSESVDVTTLLQNPLSRRGKFFSVNGTARRAIRVKVTDPDIIERFGIHHYYEVEVFDHTANVHVKDKKDTERVAVYHSYPVVFFVRTLPEGFPTGDLIHENVQVNGAYLKLWAYQTRFIRTQIGGGDGPPPMQISPLIVGRSPLFLTPPKKDPRIGMWAGIGFIAVVLALWGVVVWNNKANAKFRRETIARHVEQEWQADEDDAESVQDALQSLKTTYVKRTPDGP